jgi:hypothetical protein
MIFSDESYRILKDMRIDPGEYKVFIKLNYGGDFEKFELLLSQFKSCKYQELSGDAFNAFTHESSISNDSPLQNQLYDLFNYLRMYRDGGVFTLFKGRQSEWNGPKIKITKTDAPSSDVHKLGAQINIYRGMSMLEHESLSYGQSWTTDLKVARKFAFETYSDFPRGVVVKGTVDKNSVIYFRQLDNESEVIIEYGAIRSVSITEK